MFTQPVLSFNGEKMIPESNKVLVIIQFKCKSKDWLNWYNIKITEESSI